MSDHNTPEHRDLKDDGTKWGFMVGTRFFELPKAPMLRAGMGPPPFNCMMPDGSVRRIILEIPAEEYA